MPKAKATKLAFPKRAALAVSRRWKQVRIYYSDTPHRSFKLTPRVKHRYSLAGVREGWQLILDTLGTMRAHKRLLAYFALLYSVIAYFLIGGVSQATFVALKENTLDSFGNVFDATSNAVSLYGAALTGSLQESPSEAQQVLAALLVIIFWLAIIWAIRMVLAGNTIKLRDAFYNGMTPMIPSIFVLLMLTLQLVPGAGGIYIFSIANSDGWLNGGVETMTYAVAAGLLVVLSLYWVSGTVVALAIAALPGMYPVRALASARQLASGRRWNILMRVLVMIFIGVVIWGVVLIPIFLLDGWLRFEWLPLVPITIQLLQAATLVFGVVYVYRLYRSLL